MLLVSMFNTDKKHIFSDILLLDYPDYTAVNN